MKSNRVMVAAALAILEASAATTPLMAAKVDPRLASITKVVVVAADPLNDDRPVAACVAKRLPDALPLTVVEKEADADATLRIRADIAGQTGRAFAAALGGKAGVNIGTVRIEVLIGGTVVWEDHSTVKATQGGSSGTLVKRTIEEDRCSLADATIEDLRHALKKARDEAGKGK